MTVNLRNRSPYRLFVGASSTAAHLTAVWMQADEKPGLPIPCAPTPAGIAMLQQRLASTNIAPAQTLVVPHTGSPTWLELALTLHRAGYAVSPISQMCAANLVDKLLSPATPGVLDAAALARLAALLQPVPWSSTTITAATVQRLLDERSALLYALEHGSTTPSASLHAQLHTLEQRLASLLANDAAWIAAAQRFDHLASQDVLAAVWHNITARVPQRFNLLRNPRRALQTVSRPLAVAALAATLASPAVPQTRADTVNPAGDVFTVNDRITDNQETPAVAMDDDGDFVAVWQSYELGTAGYDRIYAKLYNSDGSVAQSSFIVGENSSNVDAPDVAIDDDGDFVVVWKAEYSGSLEKILARRYDATGTPQDTLPIEVALSTAIGESVDAAAVAMDAVGNFVVVWDETRISGDVYDGIYARQYNSDGTLQKSITVEETSFAATEDFANPDVAMDDDGDFVVAYEQVNDNYYYLIFTQSYNSAGEPGANRNPDLLIAQGNISGFVGQPAIAMDDEGNFVVAWEGFYGDYGPNPPIEEWFIGYGAVAADGTEIVSGQEIVVTGFERIREPDVAIDNDGEFVLTYVQETPDSNAIKYRVHDAQGMPVPEGIQNAVERATTVGSVSVPSVDTDASGNFVIAWEYFDFSASDRNIEARQFALNVAPTITTTASDLDYTEGDPPTPIDPGITVADPDDTELISATVEISGGLVVSTDTLSITGTLPNGITADTSMTGTVALSGTATITDYQTVLQQVTYAYNTSEPFSPGTRTVTFTVDDGNDTSTATRTINLLQLRKLYLPLVVK